MRHGTISCGRGHNGRTHDAEKMCPIILKRPKSKTRKYVPTQHGTINLFSGNTAKMLKKQRHKKKSRMWHKKICRNGKELIDDVY